MSMKDDTFETSVPPRTSRRPPAPTGSPTTLSEPTFGHLLSTLPAEEKSTVRRIEKILYKINAAETAILFNTTCINEGLLPKYTHLRLHDPNAAADAHTTAFRRKLTERQLEEKKKDLRAALSTYQDLQQQWFTSQQGNDRTNIQAALQRLKNNDRKKREHIILKKLTHLNGGKLRLPQDKKSYINLTSYTPDHEEEALLQLGLNCHYATKPCPRTKRLEIEVLLDNINRLEKEKKVTPSDSLRPLLLAEALTSRQPDHHKTFMTKDLRNAAKKLKSANGITIRRADKTPALVLINTEEYHQKLDAILADDTKFKKITRNPIDSIKKEANDIIDRINALATSTKLMKIKGDFEPGYIYGNIKTHKQGNPLRPIISQIPTPTYHLAKQLNNILAPYIPDQHRVKSSAEFLQLIKDSPASGTISSLDVESLFTNVPVPETINLICDRVYRNHTTPPLQIPEDALRRLLELCTMSAPFTTHRGHLYTQIDGVAMGSPLGVFFADFYMGVVEERVFQQTPKPPIYCRYVDDTFVKTNSKEEVDHLKDLFQRESVLRFTSEESNNGTLPFLDVSVHQDTSSNKITTDVYRKDTNLGLCLNGKSECPDRYKDSTISSYLRRAITHCSTWTSTSAEINKASQTLVNNGFSNRRIDQLTKKTINRWYAGDLNAPDDHEPNHHIRLFYKNQFHHAHKQDEKAIREIISDHLKPTSDEDEIKLIIYYKNRRTSSLIMKNNPSPIQDMIRQRNVVYHFTCPIEGCPQDYIGMTTTRLSKRISCHVQEGAIHNHMSRVHNRRPTRDQLIQATKIIDRESDCKRLRFLEALHILEKKPSINRTDEPLLLPTTLQNHTT